MKEMVFLFDGQGAFRPGVGKELCKTYQKAREMVEQSSGILGYDLTECLWGDKANDTAGRTSIAQPAISVVSLAYAEVLSELGLEGAISLGHSLGEATAIVYCGILSFDDGVRMIQKRGEVMEAGGKQGTMMAILNVKLDILETMCSDVTKEIAEPVVVANINAPNQIVISGSKQAIKKVAQLVTEARGRGIPLNIGGAWHSPYLEDAAKAFAGFLDTIPFNKPKRKFYSVVEQKILEDPEAIRTSLKKQMLSQVNWVKAVETLRKAGHSAFLEIGPSKILKDLLTKIDSESEVDSTALHNELRDITA
ncbi:MAG: ACP S-malonyltransferase [candidate division WOR-3 bacterium]|jgi:[acyl-carrier-protein] S-malonyltransferase